jgi:class 3 adenylate cyclase/tetratricopeptide (TPR) repeat protein
VPKQLAEKILASRTALEGERKQVTVLFADLKGSMELLADRDPEDARKILDPVIEHMMEAVHRYEGTVNQVMGDGIMALFGAPIAHEDHAMRACYAALRMHERVARYGETLRRSGATPIQIRVGVNSGEVVVRSIGSDLRMDYTAVGQTTHLAARMEQLAAPGSILTTADTLRFVEGYFLVKPLGPIPVKGLSQPVDVYEITGAGTARTRLQAAAARGLSRFVGRDPELDELRRALETAGGGHGQVVTVVGEAGVGKSRLFYEFIHSHRTHGWLVLEAGSVSYGKATGYLPVIDLLKSYFGIKDRDDARRVRERVTGKLLTLDRSMESRLPALLALLDLPPEDSHWESLDPRQRRQEIFDAVKRLLLRESQVQPIVLVFEDLHWVDAETHAVLDVLVESLPAARVLLLVNYRPECQHAWGQKTYYRQLRIDPLPPGTADELLEALVGGAPELRPLKAQLINRTEGNPFFLEECVRMQVETGALVGERGAYRLGRAVDSVEVPATVQAILAARIDRLAPDDKRLLQAAAVIGKDVPRALLQGITELGEDAIQSSLARLQTAEFLYETTLFPDLEYTFKHALTHEISYASLLTDRRRELHARVVGTMERLYADRIGEHAERLAHHAVRGALNDKAVQYLNEAGLKAIKRSGYREAIGFFEEALAVVARLPESRETLAQGLALRTGLGPALMATKGGGAPEVEACYMQALDLCERLGDASHRFPVLFGLWYCHYSRGEYDRAWELATEVLHVAREEAKPLLLEAHHAMWSTMTGMGRPTEALAHLEHGRRLYSADERSAWSFYATHDPGVCCRQMTALTAWLLGHADQARDWANRALELATELGHAFTTMIAHYFAAFVHYHRGERDRATEHARSAVNLGQAHGFTAWPEHAAVLLARMLIDDGRADEALALAEATLPGALRPGWPWAATVTFALVADAYGRTGRPDKGLGMLRSLDPKRFAGLYGPELHRLYAGLLLVTSPAAGEAEGRLRAAIELARDRQMKALQLRAAVDLGRLLLARGDRLAARDALSIVEWFTEGFETIDLRAAQALRNELA